MEVSEEELVLWIGKQVLRDADMIRLFMPGFAAVFTFRFCDRDFTLTIREDSDD